MALKEYTVNLTQRRVMNRTDTYRVSVIYRLDSDGEPLAIFPYEVVSSGNVVCYAHYGQHSDCSVQYYRKLQKCTQEQKDALANELRSLGYEPVEVKRFSYDTYRAVYRKAMSDVLNNI